MKRVQDYNETLPIVELYTAVQSEGSRAGSPTVVIRTTGCTHRCFFGDGGWCDSWQTSIHPEKGCFTFQDIIDMYDANPHIEEMMLTGGSPSMHPAIVNELTHFCNERNIIMTMESEGSHFLETDYKIDLISLSPKFSNSIPVIGEKTPQGKVVDEKMVRLHNRKRLNIDAIVKQLYYHKDFHLKPVWDGKDMKVLAEIEDFVKTLAKRLNKLCENTEFELTDEQFLNLVKDKTYFMPAGDSREALFESYPAVMNWVRDNGYKMTFRPHIIAFDKERFV